MNCVGCDDDVGVVRRLSSVGVAEAVGAGATAARAGPQVPLAAVRHHHHVNYAAFVIGYTIAAVAAAVCLLYLLSDILGHSRPRPEVATIDYALVEALRWRPHAGAAT